MASGGFLETFSPWQSKPATPKSEGEQDKAKEVAPVQKRGGDHRINPRQWINKKDYPEDCPPANVRWYHAVDIPKRRPAPFVKLEERDKPLGVPKKFSPLSTTDSRAIETAFQKLVANQHASESKYDFEKHRTEESSGDVASSTLKDNQSKGATSVEAAKKDLGIITKVPVNEDFLFDVDIDRRELGPAYWLGNVYDVRRATWFYDSGSSNRPCEENLALQLEEGYVKSKPWKYEQRQSRSVSRGVQRPSSWMPGSATEKSLASQDRKDLRAPSADHAGEKRKDNSQSLIPALETKPHLQTHRLFGSYMNSVVTYQDATTAFMLTDDFMSRMSSTMYERFAGGAHLSGVKIVRGFVDAKAEKTAKPAADEKAQKDGRGRARADSNNSLSEGETSMEAAKEDRPAPESASIREKLAEQISDLVGTPGGADPAKEEERAQQRAEKEMQDDYREAVSDEQGREIEHLVLVTHGIGQRLGMKLESLNFVHDVNTFRKTLKSVYDNSPDLQALNVEVDRLPKNSRVQVLPVVWRHMLDFPQARVKQRRREQDLSDASAKDEELDYPQLGDITIEGVAPVRNLIEDLFLDILLYQSTYREHIAGIVQRECNRVFKLFIQRNPNFKGKVSLVGHSLGSAIFFDLLCRQKDAPYEHAVARHGNRTSKRRVTETGTTDVPLDFEVEDMYCLGSPVGLFQMLKGTTIAGRRNQLMASYESAVNTMSGIDFGDPNEDPDTYSFTSAKMPPPQGPSTSSTSGLAADDAMTNAAGISSPKCAQLYNIFHPTDPIAYRLEPLISPAMKALKPQPLPYIKKGMFSTQGLQGIGTRVGQSVSGLWSNIATGVASSLLSRSLGMNIDVQNQSALSRTPLSMGAGTNIAGGVISGPDVLEEERRKAAALEGIGIATAVAREKIQHPPTLIDAEIETLFSGYQKRRRSAQSDSARDFGENMAEWAEVEARSRQFKREEQKVRALNSNGRVDYSIQE